MAVAPTQGLWIEATLRKIQLARIRPGYRVRIDVHAVRGYPYCGVVESMPGVD